VHPRASAPGVLCRSDSAGTDSVLEDRVTRVRAPSAVTLEARAREARSFLQTTMRRLARFAGQLCTRGKRAREGGCGGSPHQGQPANSRPRRSEKVKAGVLNQYGARFAGRAL
jgi:hypothetical protein